MMMKLILLFLLDLGKKILLRKNVPIIQSLIARLKKCGKIVFIGYPTQVLMARFTH
jgi:hypothetical protein